MARSQTLLNLRSSEASNNYMKINYKYIDVGMVLYSRLT